MFQNFKIGALIRKKYNHYYNNIKSKWTPIEPIIKEIRVGRSQSCIITRIQFSIQLVATRTIHHSQGLSLEELIFDLINVFKKLVNIYCMVIPHLNKRKLFLLTPLQHEIFYVNPSIYVEMNRLKIFVIWIPLIPQFNFFNKFSCYYTSFEYNFFTPTLQRHQP
jgi:hypothetical protein